MDKKIFVKKHLQPLLVACEEKVLTADYRNSNGTPSVLITYTDGRMKEIALSHRTFRGIVVDVAKKI